METLEVIVKTVEAQGTRCRSLRLEDGAGRALPAFEAGAHIDVHLRGGLVRQYSLANAPADRTHYRLCVQLETASRGGSAAVHALAPGARLTISAPRNCFALVDATYSVLVAAGIGITPLIAMAHALAARGAAFVLHYYARSAGEIAFADELRNGVLAPYVRFHCSDAGESARHRLPDELAAPSSDTRLYLCGPAGFMTHLRDAALARGWAPTHVHTEAFAATAVDAADNGTFVVRLASTGQSFTIPADRSIAHVLLDAGIEVPLSCEQGMCGACLTRVLDGEPDHRDTVLSDAEKAANTQIALCCSRAGSGGLTLDL